MMPDDAEASNYEAKWLQGSVNGAPLLLVSSPRGYDVGFIDLDSDEVVFQSLIQRGSLDKILP